MTILIVSSNRNEVDDLKGCIEQHGCECKVAATMDSASKLMDRGDIGLVLLSSNGHTAHTVRFLEHSQSLLKQPPVIVMSHKPSLEDAIELMKAGAQDYWVKPLVSERLIKTIALLADRSGRTEQSCHLRHSDIITSNPVMLQLKEIAKRVAASNAAVFIQGESGTGKELFAKYLHTYSERSSKPFIPLNCAALPESLIESELFGHEKGAFTGATRAKPGKFELAHTGTLFLDEVTEIPIHLQPKLLRVLQENELDRVGGKYPVPIDVRVVASTNRTIDEALAQGHFRKDLYYRLNVIPLKLPPLRQRLEDLPLLCQHFVAKYNQIHKRCIAQIQPAAMAALAEHSWPGNVRELENIIQRAMLLSRDHVISREDLMFDQSHPHQAPALGLDVMPIDDMERLLIEKALANCGGNRTRAAEILGISVRTLRNKLSLYAGQAASRDA